MISYLPHWIFYHNLVETTRKKYSINQASVSDGVKTITSILSHDRTIVVFLLLNDLNVLALVNRASMCSGQPTPTNEETDQQYG